VNSMARNLHLAAGYGDPPLLVVESGAMETLGVLGETPRCKSSPIRVRAMSYDGLETNVYVFRNGYVETGRRVRLSRRVTRVPDVMHLPSFKAPASRIYDAIVAEEGIRKWWTWHRSREE
jgi:hypothetical protein